MLALGLCLLLLLAHLASPGACTALDADSERLIGWRGEVQRPEVDIAEQPVDPAFRPWIETLTWDPRAFLYHGFLTRSECRHLIDLVKGQLQRSEVVADKEEGRVDPARTSYSASLGSAEDAVVQAIEERIANWTHLPPENGEPIEVLRYRDGQKYSAHWDFFEDKFNDERSGNRVATVLMYLADVLPDGGGETHLPLATPMHEDGATPSIRHDKDKGGIRVVPRMGDALLFWDAFPDGRTSDRHTLHAALPTVKGQKWTATRWIHSRAYDPNYDNS